MNKLFNKLLDEWAEDGDILSEYPEEDFDKVVRWINQLRNAGVNNPQLIRDTLKTTMTGTK